MGAAGRATDESTCGQGVLAALSRALSEQDDADGLEQDEKIEQKCVIFDVVQIVFELADRLLDSRALRVSHLSPPGESGLDAVPHGVERNLLGQHRNEFRPLRARSDEAHLPLENIQ